MIRTPFFVNRPPDKRPGNGSARYWGDGLLLLAFLAAVTAFVIAVYALPADRAVMWIVCLPAGGISFWLWSLSRRRLAALAALLMALSVVVYVRWDLIYHGALLHIQAVCDRLAGAFPFLAEVHLPELSSGQGDRVAANWFFGMVLVWYALALGWAVIRRRSAWLSVLLTAVWLLPAFLAEIPVDWVWVAVLFCRVDGFVPLRFDASSGGGRQDTAPVCHSASRCVPSCFDRIALSCC